MGRKNAELEEREHQEARPSQTTVHVNEHLMHNNINSVVQMETTIPAAWKLKECMD